MGDYIVERFSTECMWKVFFFALTFFCFPSVIGSSNSRHFLNELEVQPKPILFLSLAISRVWRRLHVFASSSDWFIG